MYANPCRSWKITFRTLVSGNNRSLWNHWRKCIELRLMRRLTASSSIRRGSHSYASENTAGVDDEKALKFFFLLQRSCKDCCLLESLLSIWSHLHDESFAMPNETNVFVISPQRTSLVLLSLHVSPYILARNLNIEVSLRRSSSDSQSGLQYFFFILECKKRTNSNLSSIDLGWQWSPYRLIATLSWGESLTWPSSTLP